MIPLQITLTATLDETQLPGTALQPTSVVPGVYINATFQVDQYGRVLNATSGAAGGGFSGAYADLTGKPTLGSAAATNASDYATAAQGAKADTALQPGQGGAGASLGANTFTGLQTLIAGTAAAPSMKAASGNLVLMAPAGGGAVMLGSNGGIFGGQIGTGGYQLRADGGYAWSNSQTVPGTIDAALTRPAAGLVAVVSTPVGGQPRDLSLRHLFAAGPAPTVSGDSTIVGKDAAFKVTVGPTPTGSIVITFGTPYATAPVVVANASQTTTPINVSTTTTTATLSTAAFAAGEVLHVVGITF